MMSEFKDLTGCVFAHLTVIKFHATINGASYWECLCVCGKIKDVRAAHLNSGAIKSCGCKSPVYHMNDPLKRHGLSKSKFYGRWVALFDRCYNPKHISYKNYGARGVIVCKRWEDFKNFLCRYVGRL